MKNIIQTTQGIIEYREEGVAAGPAMLILNGGHTNCDSLVANLELLLNLGYRVIIPSRPGYGCTPLSTGRTTEEAADALVALLNELGIERTDVVAISAGGRTALQLAGRHPAWVEKLILQCALSHDHWPEPITKIGAYVLFNPLTEGMFWACFRRIARSNPAGILKKMMKNLTTLEPYKVVNNMTAEQQAWALQMIAESRSGAGFLNDIKHCSGDLGRITAPTLIIHSRFDGSNDFSHAEYSAQHIPHAELFEVSAESHLMWFGPANIAIEAKLTEFLRKSVQVNYT